jgi:hypothetical protein
MSLSATTSRTLSTGLALCCVLGSEPLVGRAQTSQQVTGQPRSAKRMFQSEPGKPHALRIGFDPQTELVTVTLSVEDPDGYLIPNLRPGNFAVYEDGVLQKNATVEVDHAAVSMTVLLEGGGRYQELNQMLRIEIPHVAHALIKALVPNDKVAVLSYTDKVSCWRTWTSRETGSMLSSVNWRSPAFPRPSSTMRSLKP